MSSSVVGDTVGIILCNVMVDSSGDASLIAKRRLLSFLGKAVKIPSAVQSADPFLIIGFIVSIKY
jgi:hypothetical protein